MKTRTRETVSLLRIIAGIIFFVGITIALGMVLCGIFLLISKVENSTTLILKISAPAMIIYGIICGFWHTLVYALLNGFATLIENSDTTQVVRALYAIANSVHNNQHYTAPFEQEMPYESQELTEQEDIPEHDISSNQDTSGDDNS